MLRLLALLLPGWHSLRPTLPPCRHAAPHATLPPAFPSPELPSRAPSEYQTSAFPVRVMVFIDGSWLYYSLHGGRRECPVEAAYGTGWQYTHSVAFERLPYLISQQIHKQLLEQQHVQRLVEVTRSVVFTSARAGTPRQSTRMRMFKKMEEANFEVHMSTTQGVGEKCIDISLAVEMMHYAAVPGAYDCAVLVSGDKDFMPAMSRIRQVGKRVALVSMRNCCSRDMVRPSAHVRDFDPIWLDDFLDEIVLPTHDRLAPGAPRQAASQILDVITEYIRGQPGATASSRDIGRYLQTVRVESTDVDVLSALKQKHAGLRAFFHTFTDKFVLHRGSGDDKLEFRVTLAAPADESDARQEELLMDAKIGRGDDDDEEEEDDDDEGGGVEIVEEAFGDADDAEGSAPTNGASSGRAERPVRRAGVRAAREPRPHESAEEEDAECIASVRAFLSETGGQSSSRAVGRHLAKEGLLAPLKRRHAGLYHFLQRHSDDVCLQMPTQPGQVEYGVRLREPSAARASGAAE